MWAWCFALQACVSYRRTSLRLSGLISYTACHRLQTIRCPVHVPVTGCRPSDVQPMLGWQSWSCPRVLYHIFERCCACFFSYDISWYNMTVLHTPGLSGRCTKQGSFGYSSTVVERYKRCSGYSGSSIFTSSTTGQCLNNKGVDPSTWSRTLT